VKALAEVELVPILKEFSGGTAGLGDGSGNVIVCGEGGGGCEGGAKDTDVVVELGRGTGAVEEERELVLGAEVDGGDALEELAVLLDLLGAPAGDGGGVEADRDSSDLEAGADDGGAGWESVCVGLDVCGWVGVGGRGVLIELALGCAVAQPARPAELGEAVRGGGEGGGGPADIGVVVDSVEVAVAEFGAERLEDADGVDDVVDGGEDGVALDAPALARDVDELAGGEAEVLRYVVGVLGDEVLVEVGVVLLEGLGDDAALELVEGVGAVLGVDG